VSAAAEPQSALEPYVWVLPKGFPEPAVPADNPMSAAKVALGRRLFFETRLSVTGRYSCASCHQPKQAFTDGRPLAVGATGAMLDRGTLGLANSAYNPSYGWFDRSVTTLEAQMRQPLFNTHPVEIGVAGREAEVLEFLRGDRDYAASFSSVFGPAPDAISIDNLIRAVAAFERTLLSGHSPFDRYVFGGEHGAISGEAKRGLALFFSHRVGCATCHGGFNFTGSSTDAVHPAIHPAFARNGASDRPVRIPTLRNIALTAPYMHDGRFATLDDVVSHYERIGRQRARASGLDPRLRAFSLSAAERRELIAFLESLTDREFVDAAH
jgi:cytochrome c peroxidase